MKTTFRILSVLAGSMVMVSCFDSLNTKPLNETDFTSDRAYGNDENNYSTGLAMIYYCFENQNDLQVSDMGASEFNRAFWNLQEVSTDEAKSAMASDAWVKDINENTWSSAENAASYAVYARSMHGITYVNEFLRQTTDDKLESRNCGADLIKKIHGMRNEARIIRAYFYWAMIDIFGDVPFVTENSEFGTYVPDQVKRAEVFDYIVTELSEVAEDPVTPAARSNYPRVDVGTAYALLARVLINGEVYTGKPYWSEAKNVCEQIFKLGYELCPEYAWLFRGDNGENREANKEIMMATYYDTVKDKFKWGGTNYLSIGALQASDNSDGHYVLGVSDAWASIRAPYEFARDMFDVKNQNYVDGTYDCADDRGKLFYIKGRTEEMKDITQFTQGWSVFKYNNIPHDQDMYTFNGQNRYVSIDYPLIRFAEVYLIYAEACLHLNAKPQAIPYLNKLRDRAHAAQISDYDADWLLAERGRELFWEGHRRTDLIRFDKFCSGSFLWKYKGGSYNGQAIPEYRKLFAIPPTEMSSNKKLTQNPGYENN